MKIRLLILSLFTSTFAIADDIRQLAPTVVTATRVETNSFDLPVSIDVVGKENIQDAQLGMTLSESLIRVPGLTAQNRTQLAQDPQISSRGYGARSAFGVRGIRVYVDGISLTTPDGISQPGNIDLETVKSIEVMRGPFSTMYGSSSGGVIQLFTEDSPKDPEIKFGFLAGSYGTTKESTRFSGTANNIQYLFDVSRFDTDGYRQHSAAWKNQATGKLKFNLDNGTKATVLFDYADSKAQDPLGLARSEVYDVLKRNTSNNYYSTTNKNYSAFTNPKAAPDVASTANTRVARTNTQVGLNLEHQLNANNSLNFIGSIGNRDNLQYLAIPLSCIGLSTETGCADGTDRSYDLTKGRASSISRDFWSTELNWANRGSIFQKKYSVVTGLNFGSMEDKRKDINASAGEMLDPLGYNSKYNNGAGGNDPYGNINRNEVDKANNFDQYIQGQISALNNLDLHAGVRHSKVNMKFEGDSIVAYGTNINGSAKFEKTTSAIGGTWRATPATNLYANYGQGFETPTLIEMAYNSASLPTGPNLTLKPSTSDNYEFGFKSFLTNNTKLNVAIFKVDTKQEIIISSNSTYTVYGNSAQTKREGLELSIDSTLSNNFGLYGAYTYLDATFTQNYTSSIRKIVGTIPSGWQNLDGTVNAGNKIPGTYKHQIYGELSWKYPQLGFKTALEARGNSKVYINDLNSDSAPGYAIANIRAGFEQNYSNWKLNEYTRIENIFDKDYIGSVRVNDSSQRNFEPSAGRNYLLGFSATYQFK